MSAWLFTGACPTRSHSLVARSPRMNWTGAGVAVYIPSGAWGCAQNQPLACMAAWERHLAPRMLPSPKDHGVVLPLTPNVATRTWACRAGLGPAPCMAPMQHWLLAVPLSLFPRTPPYCTPSLLFEDAQINRLTKCSGHIFKNQLPDEGLHCRFQCQPQFMSTQMMMYSQLYTPKIKRTARCHHRGPTTSNIGLHLPGKDRINAFYPAGILYRIW